jgi:hypothetical protein
MSVWTELKEESDITQHRREGTETVGNQTHHTQQVETYISIRIDVLVLRNRLQKINGWRREWVVTWKRKFEAILFASIYRSFGTNHRDDPLSNAASHCEFHILHWVLHEELKFLQPP